MERPARSRKPQELANKEEMAGRRARLLLHIYLSSLIYHGGTSSGEHGSRVQDNGLRTVRAHSVNFCVGICSWTALSWPIV